ncbi:MAG: hypothetical protein V3W31_06270, partial [Thermodesulfobacteriota bacterium]
FTMMALWAFARYRGGKARYLVLSSFFLVVASTFKTVVVFPFAAFFFYLLIFPFTEGEGKMTDRAARLRRLALFLLPGFVVWGGVFGYFALKGTFPEFWEAVFVYNRYYAESVGGNVWDLLADPENLLLKPLKGVWPLVLLSAVWLPLSRVAYGPLRRSFFILLVLGTFIAVAGPGQFFAHYYQLLLPPLVVMSALFFFEFDLAGYIARKEFPLRAWLVTLIFLLTVTCFVRNQAAYLRMSPEEISARKYGHTGGFIRPRRLANYIKKVTRPCDTIYEWGAETGLYYYSKRKAASGIFFIYPLLVGPEEERLRKADRLLDDLTASPPTLFVWSKRYAELRERGIYDFVRERYDLVNRYRGYDVYRRKDTATPEGDGGDGGC